MTDENGQIPAELSRLKELEAKLDIYKSTLTEIYEQYDQKLEELSLVRRMGDALRSTRGLSALSQALLETVAHEVAVDRLVLMLAPEGQGLAQLFIRAAYWADQEIFSFFEPTLAVPWSLAGLGPLAPAEGQLATPLTIMSAAPEYDPLGRPEDTARSLIFLPLTVRRRPLGLLVLSRPDSRPFTPEDERMLAIMGDQAGVALSNVLLFDDLTRVNQRLTESESRARQVSNYLQRLLETANDAMFTLNHEGVITYANRKAGQWGWTKEELLGREFRSFLAEPEGLRGWAAGSPPPADENFEAVLINAAGERRQVILSTSEVSGEDDPGGQGGEPGASYASWMMLVSDMTERKHLEKQLIHSEKLASIGLLAAGVAHEVGNPLSAISGYAQILEAGDNSEDERREYLSAIINQTGRIQKILRELLDYSRPSKGVLALLDLAEALPRTLSMIQAQRVFRNIQVELDLDQEHRPHLVTMDPDHLTQITIIIAMNAAQAMGQGDFKIALSRDPGWVRLTFSDSGPGIAPEVADRIFDPFFTTKDPGEGTGLGLSICQRLVDSYQGRIDLKSAPGQGATFIISLPESGG
ncbi:MAG: GAF domain-containing protein [Candidatus Adiutrix sp.]|jgi:PAS domain S-box-containing protein|nr:GAF domain-containing protein [Candidatus Adiutrix sp.]